MIGRLSGTVVEVEGGTLLLDVGGVGYELEVSSAVLQMLSANGAYPRIAETAESAAAYSAHPMVVHTHFVVREDAQLLFGFATRGERDLFRSFIKINGVGPKLALALISSIELAELARAVGSNDISVLTQVPGVGKKTAERLMVELKNRIDTLADHGVVAAPVVSVSTTADEHVDQAQDALLALGYRATDAQHAVHLAMLTPEFEALARPGVEDIVRHALRTFAQGKRYGD